MNEEYSVGYEAGYQDGWNAAVEQPVRTKDLTDDEIWNDVYDASKHWSGFDDFNVIEFARAVIAAYKEKNK